MMDGMANSGGLIMWGMGLGGLLVAALVIIGVAALAKFLFFNNRR